jgi:hypothetical protein
MAAELGPRWSGRGLSEELGSEGRRTKLVGVRGGGARTDASVLVTGPGPSARPAHCACPVRPRRAHSSGPARLLLRVLEAAR